MGDFIKVDRTTTIMAASIVPTDYLTGYAYLASGATAPSNGIFIPLSTLTSLDASEAHASTGDVRKIVASILDEFKTRYEAQTEKPTKVTIRHSRQPSYSGTTLTINDTYTISVSRSGTIGDVAAE